METNNLLESIAGDRAVRTRVCRESHCLFFHVYFGQYAQYETADFQAEMFRLTEDDRVNNAVVIAFRNSAKSTILTMSYPIWSIIGRQKKKFVLILSQTQYQAKQHLTNIKRELEGNRLLRAEMGPFQEKEEWNTGSLVLPRFGAKITAASAEQSIRGIRHGSHRPDLVICDDIEDINSTKTMEGRDKTYRWFMGEVMPIGDRNTKVIVAGNLLHEDSLIMRLKGKMDGDNMDGVFRAYPIISGEGRILWPGKFESMADIEAERKKMGDETAWQRECMLRIVPDEGQLIMPEWIRYYDELPDKSSLMETAVGIDLAISKKSSADYTAMVSANIYGCGEDAKIYILPNPVNRRLGFPEIMDEIVLSADTFGERAKFYVESVAAQDYLVQNIKDKHPRIDVRGIGVAGADKRSRLSATTYYMQQGRILFPGKGAEDLIRQLLGFGVEKHDDLCDAYSLLVNETVRTLNRPVQRITVLDLE